MGLSISFLFLQLFSQNAKLSGKVTEENGDALISCNVLIDASKGWAAITDFDGLKEIPNTAAGANRKVAGLKKSAIVCLRATGKLYSSLLW